MASEDEYKVGEINNNEEYTEEEEEVSEEEDNRKRWDKLYNLNKLKQETRELKKQYYQEKEDEEFKSYAFKPQLTKTSMKMTENNYNTDIGKRVLEYTKRKQDKIKVINSTQEEKEFRHCTFKPHLTTNQPKIKSTHQLHTKKGIDKFVERQTKGREERKRIEKILNSNFRLKKYKATKTEDKSGYTHKYLKSD